MTRPNRSSASQSRFPRPSRAVAATAIVLGALMVLSNAGLVSAARSTPNDDQVLSALHAAFPGSPNLPPRSPLGYDAHADLSGRSTPFTDAGLSVSSSPAAPGLPPSDIDALGNSHEDHAHDHQARRSPVHKRLFQHGIDSNKNSSLQSRQAHTYTLIKKYQGATFFDDQKDWTFFTGPDPTHGLTQYLSKQDAASLINVGTDGVASIRVDNTNIPSGTNRKSVRITSQATYNKGLFIFDIKQAPYGCAVWPAAWLVGDNWPTQGEIDIIEGADERNYNMMTLHTSAGCTLKGDAGTFTGQAIPGKADCTSGTTSNDGCGINDVSGSYGSSLNAGGGGVWATLWDDKGIHIWFWPRASVPSNIETPDPSTWGTPKAFWDFATCDPSHFKDLRIVINIALGGDLENGTFRQSCTGTIADWIADGSRFGNAVWAINYLKVFT